MRIDNLTEMKHFGFGLMRLPYIGDDNTDIDFVQLERMVDAYMERGFIYFDTAYPYHKGFSERAVKKVLTNRYDREDFLVADKLPAWSLKSRGDVQTIFDEQLVRTGLDFFDFYLLHSVEKKWYPIYEKYDCFSWAMDLKREGRIRHFGISYHDDAELLEQILSAHPEIEFVQLQINYLDWDNPVVQAHANYEVCRRHGVAINVMEPVKGGTLANLPTVAEAILKEVHPNWSMASWALRYVASLDGLMVMLSGMSDEAQMNDNLDTMSNFVPLSGEEYEAMEKVVSVLSGKSQIGCTACRYCVDGCPKHILIPELFRAQNSVLMYGENNRAHSYYNSSVSGGHGLASDCIGCGKCESACPQHLPIRSLLRDVAKTFDE